MRKIALAMLISFAAQAAQAQAQDNVALVRETQHFRVVCHVPIKRAADEVAAAVEMTWKLSEKLYKLPALKRNKLLVVHLYPSAQAYETAEAKLTKGRFKKNQAFAHFESKSAHVALQPPIASSVIESHGLPTQTLRLLAHEAAHLVRYSAMRNHRSHPRWLTDGAASMIECQVLSGLGLVPHQDDDAYLGQVHYTVQELLRRKKLPPLADLLANRELGIGFSEHYDYSYLFFRKLMERRDHAAARRIFKRLRRFGSGDGLPRTLHKTVIKELGKKRLRALEAELRASITASRPHWRQVHRSLETKGTSWRQMAFPKTNAMAWRRQPVDKKNYTISGRVEILPGQKTQMNLLLDDRDSGFVSVTFTAGFGVNVFRFETATEKWTQLMQEQVAALRLNTKVPFTIEVDGSEVQVAVAGKPVGLVDVGGAPLVGPWGLGAQNGSVGIWHDLKAPGLQ